VDEQLKSAARISEHAATNLNPERPRWKERPPIISRLITAYDRLRDFPRGAVAAGRRRVCLSTDGWARGTPGRRPRRTMLSTMNRWFSARALLLHVEFWLVVAACGAATWWQASRALAGNGLSWFYTFEWPIFAGIAVAAWWHLIHENPEERAARKQERATLDPAERKAEW